MDDACNAEWIINFYSNHTELIVVIFIRLIDCDWVLFWSVSSSRSSQVSVRRNAPRNPNKAERIIKLKCIENLCGLTKEKEDD